MGNNNTNQNNSVQKNVNYMNISPIIVAINTPKISEEHKDYPKAISLKPGLEKLALKPTKFYKDKIELSP